MNLRADSDVLGMLRRGVLGVLVTPLDWAGVLVHLRQSEGGVRVLEAVVTATNEQGGTTIVLGDVPALLAVLRAAKLVRERRLAALTRADRESEVASRQAAQATALRRKGSKS